MSEEINHDRRHFLGTASMTIAAAVLGMMGSAGAQSSKINPQNMHPIAARWFRHWGGFSRGRRGQFPGGSSLF